MLGAIFAVLFGLSLLPGRKPLCLRFAEKISDGIMPEGAAAYCRTLTWIWFGILATTTLLSILVPSCTILSLFVVPAVFLVEKRIRNRRFQIVFHTSGSSGKSKTIVKTFENLAKEVAFHRKWYRQAFPAVKSEEILFLGTVQWDHMYGTLWMKMLPQAMGARVSTSVIASPEELIGAMSAAKHVFLVTTPSFLEHFVKYAAAYEVPRNVIEIVTSGSRLRRETAEKVRTIFGVCPRQIYGSTETGGIAWCRDDETARVFDAVKVSVKDGRLRVKSPYSFRRTYLMGDAVEMAADRRSFKLLGRVDRLVKINEERVNLAEMEEKVRGLGFADAALVVLEGEHGPCLGLMIAGGQTPGGEGGLSPLAMRKLLLPIFPKGTVPKRYRFVAEIPKNAQGKVVSREIAKMF